jgi:amino acid permease
MSVLFPHSPLSLHFSSRLFSVFPSAHLKSLCLVPFFLFLASIMEKSNDMKEVTSAVTKDVGDVENAGTRTHTKRGLSSRQIQFLALGMSFAVSQLIHY